MRITIRITSVILIMALLMSAWSVFAETTGEVISYTVSLDFPNNKIIIGGEIPKRERPTDVTILVLAGGIDLGSYLAAPNGRDLVFFGQKRTDNKFSFAIEYEELHKQSEFYIMADGSLKAQGSVSLVPSEVYNLAMDQVNRMAKNLDVDDGITPKVYTDDEFVTFLRNNAHKVGFDYALTENPSYTTEMYRNVAINMRNEIRERPLTLENQTSDVAKMRSFLIAEGCRQGIIPTIGTYLIDMSQSVMDVEMLQLYYSIAKTDTAERYFADILVGKKMENLQAVREQLQTALILCAARYGDGVNALVTALQNYGSLAEITSVERIRCQSILGQEFKTLEDLKEAYTKVVVSHPGSDGGGSSSQGSNGGGSNISMAGPTKEQISIPVKIVFDDLDGYEWASVAVYALADIGIVNGRAEGKFVPQATILREEFVKMIVESLKLGNTKAPSAGFTDVPATDWAYRYINIAYANGLIKGIGDGKFGKGEQLTRQDMCVIINNALSIKGNEDIEKLPFDDLDIIADYAIGAVASLYDIGAVNGITETEFAPLEIANRAQAAKIIYSVLNNL